MSARRVAIVGSGIMGSALALQLARAGCNVTVFEKGPDYPYPHERPLRDYTEHDFSDARDTVAPDMSRVIMGGTYSRDISREIVMRAGGSGTVWTGLCARMLPSDFRTRSLHGFGTDWPIGYDDLEPWFGAAEAWMGVAGTDADNPWAPPRTRPYPLPPFELTADDEVLCGRLEKAGIHMHTTPQARTRHAFDGRQACMNVGLCEICPIGARYSPNHHMQRALATGRCTLELNAAVRRVLTDATGRARGVLVRAMDGMGEREHAADVVIVCAAALESARLLLLSKDARHPDGLGNTGGHVGQGLTFHHVWTGHVHYKERMHPGDVGFWTAQSAQFCEPATRGQHGGVKIEFPSMSWTGHVGDAGAATSLAEALARFDTVTRCRQLGMHAESDPSPGKYVALAQETDRHGDPLALVHYSSSDFDRASYAYSGQLFERFAKASDATGWWFRPLEDFGTFAHYMGTCRMGSGAADSVTNSYGAVHDTAGLYVLGLPNFCGSGGSQNPTLPGLAITLRAVDYIVEQLG